MTATQNLPNRVEVSFSEALSAGVLDASNWQAGAGGGLPVSAATAEAVGGAVVVLTMAASVPLATVSYSPPPFDVVSAAGGVAAEAFSDFPLT